MNDTGDSFRLDVHLARILAALDSGVEGGGDSRASTVELKPPAAAHPPAAATTQAYVPPVHAPLDDRGNEGSLSEVLPDTSAATTSANDARPSLPTPLRIGRFELRRLLGKGGCGLVFLAYDPKLQREVALKIPRPEMLLSTDARKRILREALATAECDHPNLVSVYETGEIGPLCYIATAFCPGPTLGQWLEKQVYPVPVRQAARLIATIAEAVQHAHDRGVVHRDLKPNNIILQPVRDDPLAQQPPPGACLLRGEYFIPRVVDFGLAKLSERGGPSDTQAWQILGTPKYMAPEQALARHGELGPAADIYALGVILYELLTGTAPFDGNTDVEVLRQVIDGQITPPRQLRPEIPRDLEAICLKAMDQSPARRYRTAIDLADDLRRFLDGRPTIARPLHWTGRLARWMRRNDQLVALAVVTAIAVVMIGVGGWYMSETQRLKLDQQRAHNDQQLRQRSERQREYARYVHMAFRALQSGDRTAATNYVEAAWRLARYDNEPLDFPLHYIARLVQTPRIELSTLHPAIAQLAVTPHGRTLAALSPDSGLSLWNLESRAAVEPLLPLHAKPCGGVVPLQHGFVVYGRDADSRQTHLFQLSDDGQCSPVELPPHWQLWGVDGLKATPDSRWIGLAGRHGALGVFTIAGSRLQELATIGAPTVPATNIPTTIPTPRVPPQHWAMQSTPQGPAVVFACSSEQLMMWRVPHQVEVLPPLPLRAEVTAVAMAPSGTVAVGTAAGLFVLEPDRAQWSRRLTDRIHWLEHTPHGWVAVHKSGRIWMDRPDGEWELAVVPQGDIVAAGLAGDGNTLWIGSDDGLIRCWHLAADVSQQGVRRDRRLVRAGTVTDIASPASSGSVSATPSQPSQPSVTAVAERPTHRPAAWIIRGDATILSVAISDNRLELSRLPPGGDVPVPIDQRTLPPQRRFTYAGFCQNGMAVAASDDTGRIYIWDFAPGGGLLDPPRTVDTRQLRPPQRVTVDDARQYAAIAWDKSAIGVWSFAENDWQAVFKSTDHLDFCFIGSSGGLVTAGESGAVRLWSIYSGQMTATLWGHTGAAAAVAAAPDGQTIVSGGVNGEIIAWDHRVLREVFRERRHDRPIRLILFDERNNCMVTATSEHYSIWHAAE